MESVPQWAQEPRFLYNDDKVAQAGEVLRFLLARCGARIGEKLRSQPVREVVEFILSQDIRVYGVTYDLCLRHGETDAWEGFTKVFPEWNQRHPPTLDKLFYAGKEVKNAQA